MSERLCLTSIIIIIIIIIIKPKFRCRNIYLSIHDRNGVSESAYVGRYMNSCFVIDALPRLGGKPYILCAGDMNSKILY